MSNIAPSALPVQRERTACWHSMLSRCRNTPHRLCYKYYGARVVRVCDGWANSFEAFLEDMGPCPPGLTLDRYPNNEGNYEPGNCRWATPKQQAKNRRARRGARVKPPIVQNFNEPSYSVEEFAQARGVSEGQIRSLLIRKNCPLCDLTVRY
jgi:hypothetical protein